MDYAKSSNGRTTWSIIEGRLHESGGDYVQFSLLATDTLTLLELLKSNEQVIREAAQKEISQATAQKLR
jgi:hypothetical protein